jgi:single-strand DNA-binding protein
VLNKIILIGRLGTDPEMRFTAAGKSMTTFRLAVTTRERGTDGEMVDHTEWFTVIAFGAQADACNLWLQKGQLVYVEGRLRSRSFQGRDGVTRHVNEVLAHRVVFLARTADAQEGPAAGEGEALDDELALEPEG